jgi:hypothetical protein
MLKFLGAVASLMFRLFASEKNTRFAKYAILYLGSALVILSLIDMLIDAPRALVSSHWFDFHVG